MTETSPTTLVIDAEQAIRKIGSAGLPVLHTEVRAPGHGRGQRCQPRRHRRDLDASSKRDARLRPEAEVPAIPLSLVRGLNPTQRIAIGRALAPLRDQGVFIIASGMTFHNLRAFGDPRAVAYAEAFDAWLRQVMQRAPLDRERGLTEWAAAR